MRRTVPVPLAVATGTNRISYNGQSPASGQPMSSAHLCWSPARPSAGSARRMWCSMSDMDSTRRAAPPGLLFCGASAAPQSARGGLPQPCHVRGPVRSQETARPEQASDEEHVRPGRRSQTPSSPRQQGPACASLGAYLWRSRAYPACQRDSVETWRHTKRRHPAQGRQRPTLDR